MTVSVSTSRPGLLVVDGFVFDTNRSDFKMLIVTFSSNNFTTFRSIGTTSGYVVPGGKTFQWRAIRLFHSPVADSAAIIHMPMYSTLDAGINTGGAGGTIVRLNGGGAGGLGIYPQDANLPEISVSFNFNVPATFYPGIDSGMVGALSYQATAYAYGYEV